jgi:hypothetical protein
MSQNGEAVTQHRDRQSDRNGLQEQVVLLSNLSTKLDEYFALRKSGF